MPSSSAGSGHSILGLPDGAELDATSCREIARSGADISGERGEYHTVVYSGPLFSQPLRLVAGAVVRRDGYWFQDVSLQPAADACALGKPPASQQEGERADRTGTA